MQAKNPLYQRLVVRFAGEPCSGSATLAWEAAVGPSAPPARLVTVEAGRCGTWVATIRPGEALPAGSGVVLTKIDNEFRLDWRHQDYWPRSMGYVTVEDDRGEALPFACETTMKAATPALVTLPRDWRAGEGLVIRIGDRRWGGSGVPVWPSTYQADLMVGVRWPGEEAFRPVPGATLTIRIVPLPPARNYYVFAPSSARPDEEVRVLALPVDANGNPVPPEGEVRLGGPAEAAGNGVTMVQGHGHALWARARVAAEEGLQRLTVRVPERGVEVPTNPIRVSRDGPNVYWGEFHSHGYDAFELNILNEESDPRRMFENARDVTGLSFLATGSHMFREHPEAVSEWWGMYQEAVRAYDAPGRFVPYLGCEWRDKQPLGGDRNLVFRDLDAPQPDATWRIAEVYEHLARIPAMVIPHVGGTASLPYYHDARLEPLCEMTSGTGNSEWFAQAYLQKGYHMGMVGASDGHQGRPGHPRSVGPNGGHFVDLLRRRDANYGGGPLLGVLAETLTREALWEAFQARRTYATTGARALLDFRVNGALMGSQVRSSGPVRLDVAVEGTAPIARVDLIRGAHRLARWEGGSLAFDAHLEDRPPTGECYYYVRVEQSDGEYLWSSPIWVDSTAGGSVEGLPAWNAPDEVDLAAVGENEASQYLPALQEYLRREERLEAFERLTPILVVRAPLGDYAVFYCYIRGHRVLIQWFYEFEVPRVRMEYGWVLYGAEMVRGQPWTRPLAEGQDTLGG